MTTPEPAAEGGQAVGPPPGAFDPDWVVAVARQHDPGLPVETAGVLAGQAWQALQAIGELDAPALARALLAANPDVGASPCSVVASAAVGFCTEYGVAP